LSTGTIAQCVVDQSGCVERGGGNAPVALKGTSENKVATCRAWRVDCTASDTKADTVTAHASTRKNERVATTILI